MNEDKIRGFVGQRVATIVENFIETNCEWNHQRNVSNDEYWWTVVGAHGRPCKIGFEFSGTPNKLCFYMYNDYGVLTNWFGWEYPDRITDIYSQPSHSMGPDSDSLMKDLFGYINHLMLNTNIRSEYRRFFVSIHQEEQAKMNLNARYGLTTIPSYYETKKNVHVLKELSELLEMPIITSCQKRNMFPDQEAVINCILNQGLTKNNKEENNMIIPGIKNVFFNEVKRTTTVVFIDHTSVIVKCTDNDKFDPEMGLAMALARKCFGSRSKLQKAVAKWVKTSAPKNEQIREKVRKKAEKEAAQIEHAKAQAESYME